MGIYSVESLKANQFFHYEGEPSRKEYKGTIEERFFERGKEMDLDSKNLVQTLESLLLNSGREKHRFIARIKAQHLLDPERFEKNDWNLDLCMELAMKIIFKDKYLDTRAHKKKIRYDPRIEEPETLTQYGIPNQEIEKTFQSKPNLASSLVVRFDDYGYEGDCFPLNFVIMRPRIGNYYPGMLSSPGGHIEDVTEPTAWEEFVEETKEQRLDWPLLDYGQVTRVMLLGVTDQVLISKKGVPKRYVNYVFCMKTSNFDFTNWHFTPKTPLHDGDGGGIWDLYELIKLDSKKNLLSPLMKTIFDEIPY